MFDSPGGLPSRNPSGDSELRFPGLHMLSVSLDVLEESSDDLGMQDHHVIALGPVDSQIEQKG
jgi:hypothetical protein